MKKLHITSDPEVEKVFANYPDQARKNLLKLRALILETAEETENVEGLEETLKWGEPSYLAKHGSTLRIDWKKKKPDQYAMYFKCTSKLIPTFKMVFRNTFNYEGDRALLFDMKSSPPEPQLKLCIGAALRYHKIKHLPLLGL